MPDPAPPAATHPSNLILIGFMGSGKSSIGRMAAKTLGFQFLDTDQLIVERTGRQISEIFEAEGERAFREIESAVIGTLSHMRRCVIATGGGAVLREENRELLRSTGFVVCLTATEEVLYERVARNTKRPLLQTDDPRGTVARLMSERRAVYEAACHVCIDTTHLSQTGAVDAVVAASREAFGWNRIS